MSGLAMVEEKNEEEDDEVMVKRSGCVFAILVRFSATSLTALVASAISLAIFPALPPRTSVRHTPSIDYRHTLLMYVSSPSC